MIETLGTDFVRTARAKGYPKGKWFINMPAKLTFTSRNARRLQFSAVVSGAVLVEAVLAGQTEP